MLDAGQLDFFYSFDELVADFNDIYNDEFSAHASPSYCVRVSEVSDASLTIKSRTYRSES